MSSSSGSASLKRSRSQSLASDDTESSNKRANSEEPSQLFMGSALSRGPSNTGTSLLSDGAMDVEQLHIASSDVGGNLSSLSRESSSMTVDNELSSGASQLSQISTIMKAPLVEGETRYILARSWYRKWSAACATDAGEQTDKEFPDVTMADVGPIDNTPLVVPNSPYNDLVKAPIENQDAVFVPQDG